MRLKRKLEHKCRTFIFFLSLGITSTSLHYAFADVVGKSTATPRQPNGFDFYVKACDALVNEDDNLLETSRAIYEKKSPPTSIIQQVLTKNQKSLELVREGFNYPSTYPHLKDMESPSPEISDIRDVTRLLLLDGELKARQGNLAGAVNCYLQGIRLGVDIPQKGSLLPFLHGAACEALARRPLFTVADKLDAATARSAVLQLQELASRRVTLSSVLQEEARLTAASLPQMIRESDEGGTQLAPHTKNIIAAYWQWMRDYQGELAKPYKLRHNIPAPMDPMGQVMIPPYKKMGFQEARFLTSDRMLTVTLALRAYFVENNRYPEKLDTLVPSYLKELPVDPYSSGEPLRYHSKDKGYVLYSVGPDGEDNGGQIIERKKEDGQLRYDVAVDVKGDFVAGTNY